MINTIFYFPETLTFDDYKSQVQLGEISPKTIVFAKQQQGVYMGGISYVYKDIKDRIEKVEGSISHLKEDSTLISTPLQSAGEIITNFKKGDIFSFF